MAWQADETQLRQLARFLKDSLSNPDATARMQAEIVSGHVCAGCIVY